MLNRRRFTHLALVLPTVLASPAVLAKRPKKTNSVIVIGGGAAGLAAAISAKEHGAAAVTVLEKACFLGGHTAFAGGSVNFVDPERQKKMGINDSEELWQKQIIATGGGINDVELVRTLVSSATGTGKWLEDMGVKWLPMVYEAWSGKFPRAHQIAGKRCGMEYIRCLAKRAKQLGVQIILNAEVISLDCQKKGGCTVTYKKNGRSLPLMSDAVVLATGGFSANQNMRMLYDRRLDETVGTTLSAFNFTYDGSTGEGIQMAQALGAEVWDMEYMQLIPLNGGRLLDYSGGEIFVDSSGKRFIDEASEVRYIADAFLKLPDKTMWVITDSTTRKNSSFEQKLMTGVVQEADSVREMAKAMNVPASVLQATLGEYNESIPKASAGAEKNIVKQPLLTPPFYFGKERFDLHFCCGGLAINSKGQVLRTDGQPVPRLYAAGECTGGIHGKDRLGGDSLISCFVFGRISGASAANTKI